MNHNKKETKNSTFVALPYTNELVEDRTGRRVRSISMSTKLNHDFSWFNQNLRIGLKRIWIFHMNAYHKEHEKIFFAFTLYFAFISYLFYFFYDLTIKRQLVEWGQWFSPYSKKFRVQKAATKFLVSVFWDLQIIMTDFLDKGRKNN